jgi:hypothetical protein
MFENDEVSGFGNQNLAHAPFLQRSNSAPAISENV